MLLLALLPFLLLLKVLLLLILLTVRLLLALALSLRLGLGLCLCLLQHERLRRHGLLSSHDGGVRWWPGAVPVCSVPCAVCSRCAVSAVHTVLFRVQ